MKVNLYAVIVQNPDGSFQAQVDIPTRDDAEEIATKYLTDGFIPQIHVKTVEIGEE